MGLNSRRNNQKRDALNNPEHDTVARLKHEWFARLDQLTSLCQKLPPTGLQCLKRCSSLCCPRVQMRDMTLDRIASAVVVLLPFEMEYLIERTGVSVDAFRRWPVEMAPGTVIKVSMFDLGKPCLFLQPDFRCGIYEKRPVDCQTFPLLPVLDPSDRLFWGYGEQCPSLVLLNPAFEKQIKRIWADLCRVLPKGWWDLYHAADDWTGWPSPEESDDGG
jgi:Fe-S-cluster containining protein